MRHMYGLCNGVLYIVNRADLRFLGGSQFEGHGTLVAVRAETFPFHRVSGQFLSNLRVPSGSLLSSKTGSYSRSLPLNRNLCNCSHVFGFVSLLHMP